MGDLGGGGVRAISSSDDGELKYPILRTPFVDDAVNRKNVIESTFYYETIKVFS